MLPIGKLKSNLQFNKDLGGLIEVMKLASTLQFNQFRSGQEPSDEFIRLLNDVFGVLLSSSVKHDLLASNESLPSLFLLVSSDEGFLGDLNFLLLNKLLTAKKEQDSIACTGQQGADYLKEMQVDFSFFDSPGEKIDPQLLDKVREHLLAQYLSQKVGKVYVVYSRFISITSQQMEFEVLLPLPRIPSAASRPMPYLLIEPDPRAVVEGCIKFWLDFRLYRIFWTSKLAELAARIMHLEGSVQELGKINSRLRLEYFKHLHNLSDKSIRELTAARLIRKEE